MCQVWYVTCHVLYIYAMFLYLCHAYIFMPCFICYMPILMYCCILYHHLCVMCWNLACYIDFKINVAWLFMCCMLKFVLVTSLSLCCTKISIFAVLSSLIYILSTQLYVTSTQQIYVASRFVSSSTGIVFASHISIVFMFIYRRHKIRTSHTNDDTMYMYNKIGIVWYKYKKTWYKYIKHVINI